MDLRKIRTLLQLMNENQLSEMELEEEGMKIKLSKFGTGAPIVTQTALPPVPFPSVEVPAAAAPPESADEPEGHIIASPMPGTFYKASSPEAPPFVKVGDVVEPDTVICIIEAMKVMNEIKAECSGKVVEILVENAEAVEYGKPLFRIG